MKIAIFSDCYFPTINGVVTSIKAQLEAVRALGHIVHLYCPSYPKEFTDDDLTWRLAAFPFPFHRAEQVALPWPPKVIWKIFNEPYDVFHLQTPFGIGLLGLVVSKLRGIPAVFHHHTLWEEYVDYLPVPKQATRRASILACSWLANSCRAVISPSHRVKDRFQTQGVRTPISVIPTGIDAAEFRGGSVRPELKTGEVVCLYVGRLAFEKSLDVVIRVFEEIYQNCPSARLWMVGDGPARTALEQQVSEAGLSQVVNFFGFVNRSDLKDFVASARIFLFASLSETQGLVLLEAQAGGLPVVAVRASGVDEAVESGRTGFLIDEGDESSMATLALTLLRDDSLHRAFGINASRWALNFSQEQMGRDLVQTYQSAVDSA